MGLSTAKPITATGGDHSMGCAALSPSYKWLFLSFSGHPEDKSLILKVFSGFGGQPQKQQDNTGGTAKYQRHVPALWTVQCVGLVLYLFSSSPKSRAGAAQ